MPSELRPLLPSGLRTHRQAFSVTDLGAEFSSEWNATHIVLFLSDPHWPRAVVAVHRAESSPLHLLRVSEAMLALSGAPKRWAADLAGFLESNATEIPAGENPTRLSQIVATINLALRRNEFVDPVWDLCTGRTVSSGDLRERTDVLDALPANPGDLTLDSCFSDPEYIRCDNPFELLVELEEVLSWARSFRLPILAIDYDYNSATVWVQQSIRSWLLSQSSRFSDHESLIHDLTGSVADSFEAYDQSKFERVRQRMRELSSEFDRDTWPNLRPD